MWVDKGYSMAYNEQLAERVRTSFNHLRRVEEKKMMGGLTFMLNEKMCLGIDKNDLMVRLDPALHEMALKRKGCREMDMTGRTIRGFVFVNQAGLGTQKELDCWVGLALDYNTRAKAAQWPRKTGGKHAARRP